MAIVPPPLSSIDDSEEPLDVIPVLSVWVRGTMLGIVAGLVTVFVIAWRLDPYVRPSVEHQPQVVGALAVAPEASFPAHVPWASLLLSQDIELSTRPRRMETHRQLGLPPCTFYLLTEYPCPSCGMTTSFSLLIHGDVWNSMKANFVGTLLAAFGLTFIPWALACAFAGRTYFVLSFERGLIAVIVIFLCLLLLRWMIVLSTIWLSRV